MKWKRCMYGGCALGGGCKHKVSEKIDLDWSLRYMVGYQDGKGAKQADVDGNKAKFESVTSNRIRIGVRGKYVELEKVKPYAGIGCEYELDGKVKGTIQNGVDMLNIPASSFGGVTGTGRVRSKREGMEVWCRYKRARVFRSKKRIWRDVKVKVCFWEKTRKKKQLSLKKKNKKLRERKQ